MYLIIDVLMGLLNWLLPLVGWIFLARQWIQMSIPDQVASEHLWLVKAPRWIQCPGCLRQAVVTLRLPFAIVESPQSHKHVPFVNIASPCCRSMKCHWSPYDYGTWKLYPTGHTNHLIKFWRNSVGNFFLTVFYSFFFFKISDVFFQGQTLLAISQEWLPSTMWAGPLIYFWPAPGMSE